MNKNHTYIALYKPFRMLSQFTSIDEKLTLKHFPDIPKNVYPIGRLDYDSEGLLLLTNDNYLKTKILNPRNKFKKTYYVQVEGTPSSSELNKLLNGVEINIKGQKYFVAAQTINLISEPNLPPRNPPIRFRKNIPTSWIEITITEGKYHQIRKMTAKIGFPTLRLVRYSIENLTIYDIDITKANELNKTIVYKKLNLSSL